MKHVIVTGGSRGLGLDLVRGLLADGYSVSTCSRTPSEDLGAMLKDPALEGNLFWRECRVGDADAAEAFVEAVMGFAGKEGVYGLINNAAVAAEGVLATFPNVETEKIIGANLIGSIQMSRAVLRRMLELGGAGRVINVSSIVGSRGYTGLSVYAASKAGLDGFTRALAREVGRRQITVNSVAPGYMRTEMSEGLSGTDLERIVKRTPLGRLAETGDVVGVIRFLLSDDARFITGQTLIVDGGITC